ncbi:MAG: hypothetical protein ACKOX6_14150 [Bdellovibrio sp.]
MKYIFLILISLSASSAFCEKLIVSRTNHQGHTLVDILENKQNKYFLSGYDFTKKISPNSKALWGQTFEAARKMNSRKIANHCDAGGFKITLEDPSKKPHVHRGCYDDVLYRQIILNIKKLRKEVAAMPNDL